VTGEPVDQWVPDNPDGSGWADVDWVSAVRGSRYHYRHAEDAELARRLRPAFYRVVTRLDTESLDQAHENSYFVPGELLNEFLLELATAGGPETIWHVEPCNEPPPEANLLLAETSATPRF
jgi:hypothetical protein